VCDILVIKFSADSANVMIFMNFNI